MDENSDITVLAKGLVYARTGTASYRTAVIAALKAAKGTEVGGRTLALGRNLPGLVIAADLVSLKTADPAFDTVFRAWLRSLLTKVLDGRWLIEVHEKRPNNWGTHAGAARVAIAAYLGDTTQLARAAKVFRGFVGSRATYAGFKYGDDLTWQCDPAHPVGINPAGCKKNGVNIDGVIPDDMRRGGSFRWPPSATEYPWESLQGAVLQAELLRVAGYDSWNWENKALLRAVRFLYNRTKWPANDDDEWQTWLLDARYGTTYKVAPPVRFGKNFGFTDWIYGPSSGGGTDPTPPPTPAPTPTPSPNADTDSGFRDCHGRNDRAVNATPGRFVVRGRDRAALHVVETDRRCNDPEAVPAPAVGQRRVLGQRRPQVGHVHLRDRRCGAGTRLPLPVQGVRQTGQSVRLAHGTDGHHERRPGIGCRLHGHVDHGRPSRLPRR